MNLASDMVGKIKKIFVAAVFGVILVMGVYVAAKNSTDPNYNHGAQK